MANGEREQMSEVEPQHLDDWQHGKPPDVWSQALWLGAALKVMKALAESGLVLVVNEENMVASARYWIARVPVEVKAMWPGTFDEYPYAGESPEDHEQRRRF